MSEEYESPYRTIARLAFAALGDGEPRTAAELVRVIAQEYAYILRMYSRPSVGLGHLLGKDRRFERIANPNGTSAGMWRLRDAQDGGR